MKKILMLLTFVIVGAMGETSYKINETKIEKNLSEEEKFNILFGKTGLSFHEIRKKRTIRNSRSNRDVVSNRLESKEQIIELSALSQEEKYELLFGKTLLRQRAARTTRFIFPRQSRESLYISYNF